MDTTITLDEPHFKAVAEQARVFGQTPAEYVQTLIDAHSRTFDEILEPSRRGFDGISDDEIDDLLDRAQKAARSSECAE